MLGKVEVAFLVAFFKDHWHNCKLGGGGGLPRRSANRWAKYQDGSTLSPPLPPHLHTITIVMHLRSYSSGTWTWTYWRALSGGRCRGSSPTPFQFIILVDCQPHPTVYCWWPSFPGLHCTCLEQSARSCHRRTFRSSLLVPAWNSPV